MSTQTCLIVGSGMGGLALGALLAKSGTRVTILEAHSEYVGGYAQTLGNGTYRFAAGPRYLWNFGPGEIGERFLKHLALADRVPMVQLDRSGFDRVYLGNHEPIAVPNGWSAYQEVLQSRFPEQAAEIAQFFDLCSRVFEIFEFMEQRDLHSQPWREVIGSFVADRHTDLLELAWFVRRARWTLQRAFDACRLNPTLQAILYAHGMIFALPQTEVALFAYVAATLSYHRGCYYPAGDMHSFVAALVDTISSKGGEIHRGARVVGVESRENRIRSIRTALGEWFAADTYVCNMDPKTFVSMANSDDVPKVQAPKYEYSESLTSIYLGIRDASLLGSTFGRWNIWYRASQETDAGWYRSDPGAKPQALYLNSPSLIAPTGACCPSGGATLTAFVPSAYRAFAQRASDSPGAYQQLVERHTNLVIDLIEERFVPNLRNELEYVETRTPFDNENTLLAPKGNVYGRRLTPDEVLKSIPWRGPFDNLYSVGSCISFAGIAPVIHGACRIFAELTGDRV